MSLSNDSLVAFHYKSYGTFCIHSKRLHNLHGGFTHYRNYRAHKFLTSADWLSWCFLDSNLTGTSENHWKNTWITKSVEVSKSRGLHKMDSPAGPRGFANDRLKEPRQHLGSFLTSQSWSYFVKSMLLARRSMTMAPTKRDANSPTPVVNQVKKNGSW